MGKRGPAPKPTPLRILHGDRKDRINDAAPEPSAAPVECPEWISEMSREVWDELAPDLIRTGVLTHWDVPAFVMLCDAIATYREARAIVDDELLLSVNHMGTVGPHPALKIANEQVRLIVTLGGRFGITPSDRAQLKIHKLEEDAKPERILS